MEDRPTRPELFLLDPRVFCTVTLVVIHVSVWAAIGLAGGGFLVVDPAALAKFGALIRPLIRDDHQYWRLVTAMFLHGGISHLVLNGIALLYFGGRVEIILGRWRYLLLYFASGLTGNLVSFLWGNPMSMSVGASGAIFGVVVVYFVIETQMQGRWQMVARQPASRVLFFLVGILLALGLFDRRIDSLGHLGGAATGLVLGLFYGAPRMISLEKRWLALASLVCAWAVMVPLAARPVTGARNHVLAGLYYSEIAGEYAKGLRHFDAAVAADPRRAVAALDRSIPLLVSPAVRRLWALEALSLLAADKQAVEYYRDRARKKPSAEAYWLLTRLLQRPRAADYKAALSACSEGKKRFPEDLPWDLIQARVHRTFRRFDKALDLLEDLNSTTKSLSADYWEIAAICHLRKHDWAQAEYATSRSLSAPWLDFPTMEQPLRKLAIEDVRWRALVALGRTTESEILRVEMESQWRGMAAGLADDPTPANNLAWFLVMHGGDLDEAAELAKRSVETAPETYNLDTLAWVEYKRKNYDQAWAAMQRALADRRSEQPDIYYRAGAILYALGRNDEARRFLERAVGFGLDFDEYEAAEKLLRQIASPAVSSSN